jgi:type IV secretion system protein VirB10
MKLTRSLLAVALSFSLFSVSFLSFSVQQTFAQDSKIAVQRGYRTGYSDGYMAGYRDTIDAAAKRYDKHAEYARADRAFNKDYGSLENYRDGYQQGFEAGYDTGYEKRSFDATIPPDLKKRGVVTVTATTTKVDYSTPVQTSENTVAASPAENTTIAAEQQPAAGVNAADSANRAAENVVAETQQTPVLTAQIDVSTPPENNVSSASAPRDDSTLIIPNDTELIVELVDDITTQRSREGDKFQARVVSPSEMNGAIIEGRISKIQRPGRIKRRAEMLLSFDRIVLPNNRWSNFNAIVTEVLPVKGDNVKRVDAEGTVEGRSSVKDDSVKVGASTGTGIVIGAIAGGPVGAAVGAGVGAAFGVGAVVIERGKDIRLNKNQQLRIKTAYETQIR